MPCMAPKIENRSNTVTFFTYGFLYLSFLPAFSCVTANMDRLSVAASMVELLMAARQVAGISASAISNAQNVLC